MAACRRTPAPVSRLPNRHRGSNGSTPRPAHASGMRLSLRGDHRESEAPSFRSGPWAAVRRAKARSSAAGPGFGGREPSRFLGTKRWKSQKLSQLLPERTSEGKGQTPVSGHLGADHLLRCGNLAGFPGNRPLGTSPDPVAALPQGDRCGATTDTATATPGTRPGRCQIVLSDELAVSMFHFPHAVAAPAP